MALSSAGVKIDAVCGFYCQECGHKFKTLKAAEKAAFGDSGCPKCGSSDIDLGRPVGCVGRMLRRVAT